MKCFIKIILVSSIITLFGSCENILETIPNDRISSEIYWKTEDDAKLAANAVYTFLDNIPTYFSWDGMSDIGHTNVPFNAYAIIEIGQHDALHDVIFNFWTNSYAGIRSANSFLQNVDRVETVNLQNIEIMKGEIKVLRAYFYMRLAALYGDVPLVTHEITLEESRSLTRTPVSEVWDFVATQLDEAAAVLPTAQADKGRATKGAALALKARAMLWAGRHAEAATAAKGVMDLGVYSLYPSYEKLFTYEAENNSEIIFDKQFVKDIYRNNIFAYMAPYSQKNSTNHFVPLKKLVDSYHMNNGKPITDPTSGFNPQSPYENRDPRLRHSIFVLGDILPDGKIYDPRPGSGTADAVDFTYLSTSTGFALKKYINAEDYDQPSNGGVNLILMRYPEILLTYAEAKIELNQLDQSVVDAINTVRQRADVAMPLLTSIGSQEEMRAVVRHERMVELAFEGLRYFDVRRWGIAESVIPGTIYGMTYEDDNGDLQTIEIQSFEKSFVANRDYLWPIPQKERELNPNLTKNPNW